MTIGRLGARDLKNGRPAACHVTEMDGQDLHSLDWLRIPKKVSFRYSELMVEKTQFTVPLGFGTSMSLQSLLPLLFIMEKIDTLFVHVL
jgi:hypothetical protein